MRRSASLMRDAHESRLHRPYRNPEKGEHLVLSCWMKWRPMPVIWRACPSTPMCRSSSRSRKRRRQCPACWWSDRCRNNTTEVGERVRAALAQLEKILGACNRRGHLPRASDIRDYSSSPISRAWRRRRTGAEQAVKAFASYYRNNAGEFPAEVREKAYEEQMRAAYPVHPELFRLLQTDWGSLDKFQRTRGVLKMMAQIVFRLWRDEQLAADLAGVGAFG